MSLPPQWLQVPVPANPPIGTYQYVLLEDTGDEQLSMGGSSATRLFMVDWTQRAQFQEDLLGRTYAYGLAGGTAGIPIFTRILPDEHPEFPAFFAETADVKHWGPPLGVDSNLNPIFPYAMITATYTPRDYYVIPDDINQTSELYRYIKRDYQFTTEYLTLNTYMKFVKRSTAQNKTLDTKQGILTGYTEKTYTWMQVPADPNHPFDVPNEKIITGLNGKCNSLPFDGNPFETVLFTGVEPELVKPNLKAGNIIGGPVNPQGGVTSYYWNIKYKFLIKNNGIVDLSSTAPPRPCIAGVNFIYDTLFKRWDLLTTDGLVTFGAANQDGTFNPQGTKIYSNGDLNNLFRWTNFT